MAKDVHDLASVRVIGFDGDDTLWHSENHYYRTEEAFHELLSRYAGTVSLKEHLYGVEMRNLRRFGYGPKGFTLSMIESALDVSGETIPASDVRKILDLGKQLIEPPMELCDGVRGTLELLAERFKLLLITKGELHAQESKIARSGISDFFTAVQIVSQKDGDTYRDVLRRHSFEVAEFLMVGNSIRSDVLPILEIGGQAVHIPYSVTWRHESVEEPAGRYLRLGSISELPEALGCAD